jgi:superfamily I DNA/RNA helicase
MALKRERGSFNADEKLISLKRHRWDYSQITRKQAFFNRKKVPDIILYVSRTEG